MRNLRPTLCPLSCNIWLTNLDCGYEVEGGLLGPAALVGGPLLVAADPEPLAGGAREERRLLDPLGELVEAPHEGVVEVVRAHVHAALLLLLLNVLRVRVVLADHVALRRDLRRRENISKLGPETCCSDIPMKGCVDCADDQDTHNATSFKYSIGSSLIKLDCYSLYVSAFDVRSQHSICCLISFTYLAPEFIIYFIN